jgi:glycosyltransferase involved in cell wall biosynthesis
MTTSPASGRGPQADPLGEPSTKTPRLSVILPVYNAEQYLGAAIESILEQTFTDFELLLIDDGSTDGSLEIIRRYARVDERVRSMSRRNHGLVHTLNEGIASARAEYVARMDADDISKRDRFEKQVTFLDANPHCVALGTNFILTDEAGQELITWRCFINDLVIRHALPVESCIPHPTVMFRKSAVTEAGGYREQYPAAEDYDLWRRLVHLGELTNLAEPLLYKREADRTVSRSHAALQRSSADRIRTEVWDDDRLSAYKRISLTTLSRLPGEHQPALRSLQKALALRALRRLDVRLLVFLCWDIAKFVLRTWWNRRHTAAK